MKLSIVIVNYNTDKLLNECIRSLSDNYQNQFKNDNYELIIVDNASKYGNLDFIHKIPLKIKLVKNTVNVGYAKANNLGIKISKGEYVLLLNPDTIVYKHSLDILIKYLDTHQNTGIVSPKVVMTNGEIDDASHRGFPTPWRSMTHFLGLSKIFPKSSIFNGYHLGYCQMNIDHEIDACAGACMMVRRKAGEQVSWLDEDYFWYGDDIDFCYRVKELGFKIFFLPTASILHYKGVAGGIKKHSLKFSYADKQIQTMASRARFQAMRLFYKKHYEKKYPKLLTSLIFLTINIKEKINSLIP